MFFDIPAYAQTAGAPPVAGPMDFVLSLLPFVAIIAIFYFLVLRPQQKQRKAHAEMIASLRRGDTVVTYGGMIGKVAKVADDEISVEVSENTRIRIVRSMIMEVRDKTAPVKANDNAKAAS